MSQTKAQLISDLVQALNFTGTSSAPANGMYLSAANTIKLATNSNGRLTIDSSGNATFTGTCTATTFVGALTGNASGSAATVTGAAQTAITSVGTLTGLTVAGGQITANSSNATKYVRMYGAAGTGQWDIYGHGGNLRFSDNASAGYIVFDHRVGIGTTAPTQALSVNAGSTDSAIAIFTGDDLNRGLKISTATENSQTDMLVQLEAHGQHSGAYEGEISLKTGGAHRLRVDKTGNVGIGTSSPSSIFHVQQSGGTQFRFDNDYFYIKSPDGGNRYFFGETQNDKSAQLSLYNSSNAQKVRIAAGDGASEAATFFNGGKVGIGTSSPDTLLHIAGGSPYITLNNTGTSASANDILGSILFKHADADDPGITAKIQCVASDSTGNSFLAFYNGDGGNADERMRINEEGKVLIAATTPGHANADDLTIGPTTAGARGGLTINAANDLDCSIHFGDSDSNLQGQINYHHDGDIFRFYTGATPRVRIDSDGIKFGTDSAAANGLDDYEEGTWNPQLVGYWSSAWRDMTNDGTVYGNYVKVGNLCYIYGYLDNVQFTGNGVDTYAAIWSLPFNHANTGYGTTISVTHSNIFSNCNAGNFYVGHNNSRMYSSQYGDNEYAYCTWSGTDTRYMMFSGCYHTS